MGTHLMVIMINVALIVMTMKLLGASVPDLASAKNVTF
jgi:hypothetical protein